MRRSHHQQNTHRFHRSAALMAAGLLLTALGGCEATYHNAQIQATREGGGLTTGTVQRELKVGMTNANVAEVLGSPNIVSTDDQGREVWVYDRTATEVVASQSSWFVTAGAASRTQRTLTVIVKFDSQGKVRDIAYHSSQF